MEWFGLLLIAALTTSITIYEVIITALQEKLRMCRGKAIFVSNRYLPRRILLLTGCFARAAAERHSISRSLKSFKNLILITQLSVKNVVH